VKYSIGEMSRLFDIPVTTLRHYDNKGIFKAAYVDDESGYRYYTSDQFELLNNIVNLRYSEIPLEKIREYTEKGDTTSLKEMFLVQQTEVRTRIKELKKIERSIGDRLAYIGEIEEIDRFDEIIIRKRSRRRIFTVDKEFQSEEELELLVRELGSNSNFSYSLVLGNVGLLMERGREYSKYRGVYLNTGSLDENEPEVEEQPGGEYITIHFKGTRRDSCRYYQKLDRYIDENNISIEGPYYEMALVCDSLSSDEKRYIRMIEIKKVD